MDIRFRSLIRAKGHPRVTFNGNRTYIYEQDKEKFLKTAERVTKQYLTNKQVADCRRNGPTRINEYYEKLKGTIPNRELVFWVPELREEARKLHDRGRKGVFFFAPAVPEMEDTPFAYATMCDPKWIDILKEKIRNGETLTTYNRKYIVPGDWDSHSEGHRPRDVQGAGRRSNVASRNRAIFSAGPSSSDMGAPVNPRSEGRIRSQRSQRRTVNVPVFSEKRGS